MQYAPPFENSYQNKAFIHLQVKKWYEIIEVYLVY